MIDLYAMTYVTRGRSDLVTDLRHVNVTAAMAWRPLRCTSRALSASVARRRGLAASVAPRRRM